MPINDKEFGSENFIPQANAMASDSFPPAELKEIVNEVATLLKEKKETVAVAETVRNQAISVTIPMNTIRCKQQEIGLSYQSVQFQIDL